MSQFCDTLVETLENFRYKIQNLIKITEDETNKSSISDQAKFLADQKIQVLRSIN